MAGITSLDTQRARNQFWWWFCYRAENSRNEWKGIECWNNDFLLFRNGISKQTLSNPVVGGYQKGIEQRKGSWQCRFMFTVCSLSCGSACIFTLFSSDKMIQIWYTTSFILSNTSYPAYIYILNNCGWVCAHSSTNFCETLKLTVWLNPPVVLRRFELVTHLEANPNNSCH